jgi:hypothetical protein
LIFEALVDVALGVIQFFLGLVPTELFITTDGNFAGWFEGAVRLVQGASQFIPMDIVTVAIGNIIVWQIAHFIISIVRVIVDFLPFF